MNDGDNDRAEAHVQTHNPHIRLHHHQQLSGTSSPQPHSSPSNSRVFHPVKSASVKQKSSTQSFTKPTLVTVPELAIDGDSAFAGSPEQVKLIKTSKPYSASASQLFQPHRAVSDTDWNRHHSHHHQQLDASRPASTDRTPIAQDFPQPPQTKVTSHPAHRALDKNEMSHHSHPSSHPPSIFDDNLQEDQEDLHDLYTDPSSHIPSGEDPTSFDLKPPPPSQPISNIEYLAERLFSSDHLKLIVRDHALYTRFTSFLTKYRPHAQPALQRYVETQKAAAAVDYANAVAEQLAPGSIAAMMEDGFEENSRVAIDELVNDALPGYVTHRLVQIVTDTLVKEITGQNTPIMRELVNGLAEVYCLTDPMQVDNPIVFASEEFFRCTQYGKDYVIGRNCRFLQGPKSSGASVDRLIAALSDGQEICETILNYRRDGTPFVNLLMIAPLYDNQGRVRYFIGAQIDINGLIEGGRGLDSFERLLAQDRQAARHGEFGLIKSPQAALGELSNMFTEDDMEIVRHIGRETSGRRSSGASTPVAAAQRHTGRRYVGMDDPSDRNLWPAPHLGPSGRLPGVFQNYLLVRPWPSLRITFTSPALRIPGLLQSRFLDRIGGQPHIREGIQSAMSAGISVTAKVTWIPTTVDTDASPQRGQRQRLSDVEGRHRWIHATPLLGSDEKVGVWMVVMVESEQITGSIHAQNIAAQNPTSYRSPIHSSTSGKLYTQYLRREGRNDSLLGVAAGGAENHHPSARPGTAQAMASSQQHPQGKGNSAISSAHGSTRSRNTTDLMPPQPQPQLHVDQGLHFGQSHPAQATSGAISQRAGAPSQHQQHNYEIRNGPYTGGHPTTNGVRKFSNSASGLASGNLTGLAAATYGPSPPTITTQRQQRPASRQAIIEGGGGGGGVVDREMTAEHEAYERKKEERKARVRDLQDSAMGKGDGGEVEGEDRGVFAGF